MFYAILRFYWIDDIIESKRLQRYDSILRVDIGDSAVILNQ